MYTATATGIGDVTVTITVENGVITSATVDTSNETEGKGKPLGDQFAGEILSQGDVDAVSGCTVTYNAVKEALEDCKRQAGIS